MVEEGEEEVECDHVNDDLNTKTSTQKKDNSHQECITKFCALEDEAILTAKTFSLKDNTNKIFWDIQPDGEYLEWDDINCNGETWKEDIELSDETHLNAVFFDNSPLELKDMPNS